VVEALRRGPTGGPVEHPLGPVHRDDLGAGEGAGQRARPDPGAAAEVQDPTDVEPAGRGQVGEERSGLADHRGEHDPLELGVLHHLVRVEVEVVLVVAELVRRHVGTVGRPCARCIRSCR
jgi:hypothetical protein